jgi:hypothetical protein
MSPDLGEIDCRVLSLFVEEWILVVFQKFWRRKEVLEDYIWENSSKFKKNG